MKKLYFQILFLIFLILQSCTFEPKGDEFVQVDPSGKRPEVQINLNLAADTLYIPTNTIVNFAYGLSSDKINWTQFIVNGAPTNVTKLESNMVTLSRVFNEPAGKTFLLEMNIFAKSQTGSIADKLNAEGYLISRQWTIVMVNTSQLASNIIKADFVDGTFKIEWEKYKGMEFKDYKIYKTMPSSTKGKFLLATINSREQTSFVDTTFCGEESVYYIMTNDTYQGNVYWQKSLIPVLTSENTANGEILFKWTKPPYYKNLKGYRISYYDTMLGIQPLTEIADGSSESYNIPDPLFAHSYKLYLTPLGKTDNSYTSSSLINYLSTYTTAMLGTPVPKYSFALSGRGSMIYCIDQGHQVFLYDPIKFTTTRQIKYNESIYKFAVSLNDKYLVNNSIGTTKINFEDLIDPSKSKRIDIAGSTPQSVDNMSISDAGTGVLMTYSKCVLFDYLNERKLADIDLAGTSSYSNKISSSGKFFYLDKFSNCAFYQYKDNQVVLLESGIIQGDYYLLDCYFIPGNNEKIVRAFRNRIEILDCNTWTIEKTWLYPNQITHVFNFDVKSGKLLINEKTKMVAFDVVNGTREELATVDNSIYNITSLFYSNGYLYWGEGFAYKKN
ncbi:MAG: hypothetical protein Q8908_10430 [Bacteroidota bacterium]|nr:hypothetical protein [Bacteroidota bacterium]